MPYYLGLVQGRGNGLFDPEGLITRQEAAVMLTRAYGICGGKLPENTGQTSFTDETEIAGWAKESARALSTWNVVKGMQDVSFSPNGHYTVEQCLVTLLRLYENAPVSRIKGNVKPLFTYEQAMDDVILYCIGWINFFTKRKTEVRILSYMSLKAQKKKFEQYPILTSDDAYQEYSSSSLRDNAMHDLGVGSTHTMKSVITGIFLPSLRCSVYTPTERINIWRGKAFATNTPIVKDGNYSNAMHAVPSIEIPIYFFAGKYDYTCCYSLQRAYYQTVKAPERALTIFTQDVLKGTNTLSD